MGQITKYKNVPTHMRLMRGGPPKINPAWPRLMEHMGRCLKNGGHVILTVHHKSRSEDMTHWTYWFDMELHHA